MIFDNIAAIEKEFVIEHVQNLLNMVVHKWRELPFEVSCNNLLKLYCFLCNLINDIMYVYFCILLGC